MTLAKIRWPEDPDVAAKLQRQSELFAKLAETMHTQLVPALQKAAAAVRELNEAAEYARPIEAEGKVE